ncbi:MAG: hypothetical protein J2P20_16540 [Pseudonocardia sp.]|nr:hypothetical protein [Pseudonocardia sp.]
MNDDRAVPVDVNERRTLDGAAAADRAEAAADRTHALLVLLVLLVDTALLAMLQVMFLTASIGQVPVPLSALVALVSTPWLVRRAGEVTGVAGASAVLVVWLLTASVLSLAGPGGDALLPAGWSTPVLLAAALLPGAFTLGRVIRARLATGAPGADARDGGDEEPS